MLIYRSVTSAGPWPRAPSPQQQKNHLIYVGTVVIIFMKGHSLSFILRHRQMFFTFFTNRKSLFYEQIIVIGRFWFSAKESESAAKCQLFDSDSLAVK